MGQITVIRTPLKGLCIIEPQVFGDNRGYFMEIYNRRAFEEAGLHYEFVQDNQSSSCKGVLRGLHFQSAHPQAKLVRVISGNVFDVAVDLRPGSPTWGKWMGVELSGENKKQVLIPRGFAHGFLVLSDRAEFSYKCDDFYCPDDDYGILWSDRDIGIQWPSLDVPYCLSKKDQGNPPLRNYGELWRGSSPPRFGKEEENAEE